MATVDEIPVKRAKIEEQMIEAWIMDDSTEDQRLPHQKAPNEPVSPEQLRELGVLYWKLDADNYENDEELKSIREERGYNYQDIITITPERLPDYENKIKIFFQEHIHQDEEIRYILDGSGYFDVRDLDDRWVRIAVKKGDMIVLPEGIYHRFTLDENNFIQAMRLFQGEPIWTPYNRPEADTNPSRSKYIEEFGVHIVSDNSVREVATA